MYFNSLVFECEKDVRKAREPGNESNTAELGGYELGRWIRMSNS